MSRPQLSRSFSLLNTGRGFDVDAARKKQWLFSIGDMSVVHGSFPRFAEVGAVPGLAGALLTDAKKGLYEAEVKRGLDARKEQYGQNVVPKPPLRSFFDYCLDQLEDPMLRILSVAGTLSLILGAVDKPGSGWIEGVAILSAVTIVTVVGAANEVKQAAEFRRLDESNEEEAYRVLRGGESVRIYQSQIVVGDLVELSAGDEVPADGVYVFGDDPACNEAKMTGESLDIEKGVHEPFLLAGTEVRRGELVMLVTGVGINTSYGRIMAGLVKPSEITPLQRKLEQVAELVGYMGAGVAIVLFFSLLAFWIEDMVSNDKRFSSEAGELLDFFIIAVTIVVVAVPEGLPLAVTISLAYSMKKMVADQNLVRILSACETMGNATAICSDKTGTLTQNEMTVMKGWLSGTFYEHLDETPDLHPHVLGLVEKAAVINSKADIELDGTSGDRVWKGNQTEIAILKWTIKHGIDVPAVRAATIVHKNYPFDSMKKNSSVLVRHAPTGGYRRYFKGAAEQLLERSCDVLNVKGEVVDLGPTRKEVAGAIQRMTETGLRTIAFAYQDLDKVLPDPNDPNKLSDPPEDAPMTFVGAVGIKDPLRKESRRSVRQCQMAGVVVRMVTGDHPATATFIARECGIITSEKHLVMTGDQFRQLMASSEDEQESKIPYLRVLARSKPEDKKELVEWLKAHGEIVAATGDGTNDAPALKAADVGIAMNIVGTAVAKAAAEILILDDNFASVVKAIMWGRSVFDNIRKFVQFQLTINIVALSITLIGVYTRFENPLKAVQLLWVNLIMDTMAALALGTEMPTLALLGRRPYSQHAPLISHVMWRNIIAQAGLQLVVLMIVMYAGDDIWNIEYKSTEHFTIVFNTFVFLQVFNEINSRKVNGEMDVFERFFDNSIFSIILLVTVFFQVLMVELFGDFADTTGLTAAEWLACLGFGFLSLPYGAIVRLFKVDNTDGMIELRQDAFEGFDHDEQGGWAQSDI